jgi:putative ABC transport system permease protein
MKLIATIKEARLNLFSSKMRSLLALLGILVGTASVVAMVSGGELATNEALKEFKTLGTDLLAVSISAPSKDESDANKHPISPENLTLPQAEGISSADPQIFDVAPYTQTYAAIRYQGREINATILGVSDSFARIVRIHMAQGRFVSTLDKYASFCVIGQTIYEQMKKISFQNPLGAQLQVGQNFFTVIGVAERWPESSFVYANVDNSILMPILTSTTVSQYAHINNIIARLSPHADIDRVSHRISEYMDQQSPGKHLFFRSAKELIASMKKQSQVLTVFLGLIGSISLIVGGIGVMNIMLVSVIERKREIGIRLAVGATRADIRFLFLIEAIMLSLVGGVLGVLIGAIIAYVIALCWHWDYILLLWPPLIGFSVSVAIGIFFGFYPAHQAAQLDPIAALRAD